MSTRSKSFGRKCRKNSSEDASGNDGKNIDGQTSTLEDATDAPHKRLDPIHDPNSAIPMPLSNDTDDSGECACGLLEASRAGKDHYDDDYKVFIEEELCLEEEELKLRRKRLNLKKSLMNGNISYEVLKDICGSSSNSPQIENAISSMSIGNCLPKIEIEPFSGSPDEFVSFRSAFRTQIETQVRDPPKKLSFLIYYCRGIAKEAIKHCVLLPNDTCFSTAIDILTSQFGRPHQIIQAVTENLFTGPVFRSNDMIGLQSLLRQMRSCSITLSQLGRTADLNCTVNLIRIVKRLPKAMQIKWAEVAESVLSTGHDASFEDLLTFIERRVAILGTEYGAVAADNIRVDAPPRGFRVTATNREISERSCCLCKLSHNLSDCAEFSKLNIQERWNILKRHKRCFRCLKGNHRADACKASSICGVNNCQRPHHTMLHATSNESPSPKERICTSFSLQSSGIQLGFVPLRIHGPNGFVSTYGFLDNGSDCSLLAKDLAIRLGLLGDEARVTISTLHGTKTVNCGLTKATIKSITGEFTMEVDSLLIVDELPVRRADLITTTIRSMSHLKDIEFPTLPSSQVGLLLGCDIPAAHWVEDQRVGRPNEPFACKSPLGWILRGPTGKNNCLSRCVNAITNGHVEIDEMLRQMYDAEFMDRGDPEEVQHSIMDAQALETVSLSTRFVNGHYEVGVPWREQRAQLPDSKVMAERRLHNLKMRLKHNGELRDRYVATMKDHLAKGYVSQSRGVTARWFLPHHPVVNPHKPEKLRIVFDCAAKVRNVSLNDALLKGPDWTNNLAGVLLRFRERRIALSADIKEMFLQVRLPKSDRWAFSFLWWKDGEIDTIPETYAWNVHPFGAVSSPFCANYALRRAAIDNNRVYDSEVTGAVRRNFYVDDYLGSVDTIEEARAMATQLRSLLKEGGFELTKWASNVKEVLRDIPPVERTMKSSTQSGGATLHRTLGVKWDLDEDTFSFNVDLPNLVVSRRTILAYIASIFDPLGFIAPIILPGKKILQELCRSGIGWDARPSEAYSHKWSRWCERLQRLGEVKIPRCLMPTCQTEGLPELHLFSDASESGYGAVSYLLMPLLNGNVHCSFLIGKSRVAPLKFISIPRLELTAALLAAKMFKYLKAEISLDLKRIILWTDSATVLRYLSSTSARFATFVANRVRRIQELTTLDQWRYVPSEDNPADVASRGVTLKDSRKLKLWLEGPAFLRADEINWPSNLIVNSIPIELELKRMALATSIEPSTEWWTTMSSKSTWASLLRKTVWITRYKRYLLLKFKSNFEASINVGPIKYSEMKLAEADIIRLVQDHAFVANRCSHHPSQLDRLRPVRTNGMLCLGGRVVNTGSKPCVPILPNKSRVTELIIEHYHRIEGHSGPSHVLSIIRRGFWIIHGMATVRRVLNKCPICRLRTMRPCQQAMAPLPISRIEVGSFPFRYTGVDYFGPFLVKQGRNRHKRFGCLFTCMQCRAVHIEVAQDLTTDSFIMALTRFMSRRGNPEFIYSDNGSNFVGAERELRRLLDSLDGNRIREGLHARQVEWHFNPPFSSHRGGVWERMIRSVRKTLQFVAQNQVLTDEVLLTSFAEVERIINNRPIIPVYDDPTHPVALCPNDLLILRPSVPITNEEIPLRERYTRYWRQAQHLANVFWRRWLKEYLPTLQANRKWLKPRRNLQPGDLVLLHKADAPRDCWPKGVVDTAQPGADGLVRQVSVRTTAGLVRRDVRSLCLLEGADEYE